MSMQAQFSSNSASSSAGFSKNPRPFQMVPGEPEKDPEFDVDGFLLTGGDSIAIKFRKAQSIFAQGDAANSVYFVRSGNLKLVVVSNKGKEATIGVIGAGNFCGEGCLTDEPVRALSAIALTTGAVLRIPKKSFSKLLRDSGEFSAVFMKFLVSRSLSVQRDLIEQRFHPSEHRLARLLLTLSDTPDACEWRMLPRTSQEALASMVGTTRSRISFFLNKFKKQGLIEYSGGMRIKRELGERFPL